LILHGRQLIADRQRVKGRRSVLPEQDLRLKAKGKTGKLCKGGSYEKNSRFKGSLSMVIPPNRGYEKVFEILISLSYGSLSKNRALGREFFCLIQ